MANWKKIYETKNPVRAEIVRSILSEEGLMPILVNKQDSAYPVIEGGYEIYVTPENVMRSIKIINHEITFDD